MSDMPSAFHAETRKARKAHVCCECGTKINKGEEYRYSSGVWDGRGDSYKQCNNYNRVKRAREVLAGTRHDLQG